MTNETLKLPPKWLLERNDSTKPIRRLNQHQRELSGGLSRYQKQNPKSIHLPDSFTLKMPEAASSLEPGGMRARSRTGTASWHSGFLFVLVIHIHTHCGQQHQPFDRLLIIDAHDRHAVIHYTHAVFSRAANTSPANAASTPMFMKV